jgi:hypothetical protein
MLTIELETNLIISITTLLCRFIQNPHQDSPGTCSAVPIEKGQPSTTAFRPPASDPSGTTPRMKRRKIDYLTESALKELGNPNGTHLACEQRFSSQIELHHIPGYSGCFHKPDTSLRECRGS